MTTAIEVSVANVTEEGITFKVVNFHHEVLGENLSLGEIDAKVTNGDWHVGGCVYRLMHEVTPLDRVNDSRKLIAALQKAVADYKTLEEERYSTCDRERHQLLAEPGGLIRRQESRIGLYRLAVTAVLQATLGVSAGDMRNMGLC